MVTDSRFERDTMSEKPPMHSTIGRRRFGRVNGPGLYTLTAREIHRFGKIWLQTILAPVVAALLFLVVFDLAFADQRSDINGVTFAAFLAPGMVMMAVIQNSFANTSSSVLHAKILGNIVDTVAAPLSPTELNIGYALGGAARGLTVAVATSVVLFPLVGTGFAQPLWATYFVLAACLLLANIGIVTGMWAEKFDHTATVTNFIVTPLSFLSGTFYSVSSLPEPWNEISRWNPFFYLIDGFRYGVLGVSDAEPSTGLAVTLIANLLVGLLTWRLFQIGYKLKD